jgi:hypothetical protein
VKSASYKLRISDARRYTFAVMAMTPHPSGEYVMTREDLHNDLIDLGPATRETKGIVMGYEDSERGQWIHGPVLADD